MGQVVPDDGVYVVYSADLHGGPDSIHKTLKSAVREADTWQRIGFWRWNTMAEGVEEIEDD